MKKIVLLVCLLAWAGLSTGLKAQIQWPEGKKAAVVLTYDDNLPSHHEVVMPQLEEKGFRGTFFLYGRVMKAEHIAGWREASKRGHELGNHSLFHPCETDVTEDPLCRSLKCYSMKEILIEVQMMKSLLYAIDGKDNYAYAFPCGHTKSAEGDYSKPLIESGLASYGRAAGISGIASNADSLNLAFVPTISTRAGWSGEKLISYVDQALEKNGLLVFIFHGVGGDYMKVEAEDHQQLVDYLSKRSDIWVGTFSEVMDHVSSLKKK